MSTNTNQQQPTGAIDDTAARLAAEFTGLGVDADWVQTVSKICDGKYLLARALLLQQLPQKSRDEYVQQKVATMSVIQPYTTASNECGYCQLKKGSVTYGMNAQRITVEDYQLLLDRGWRRSGKWLYQPQNSVTCCPQHTIRLPVHHYSPSRAHKQLRRRLARYLKGEILPNKEGGDANNVNMTDVAPQPNKEKKNFDAELQQLTAPVTAALAQVLAKCGYTNMTPHVTVNDRCHWPSRGHLTSHVSLQLAGRELKEQSDSKAKNSTADPAQKKTKNSKTPSPVPARAKEIATRLISESGESRDWTLSVADTGHVLIRITNTDFEQKLALFVEAHRKPSTCPAANNSNKMDTEPKHKLKITLHRAGYTDESYRLFKKYQMAVHHEAEDEVSRDGYERFLVKGPLYNGTDQHGVVLNRKELPEELQGLVEVDTCQFVPYGAYHQHYRLDDKLIAVAVLDVLPKCLSSVYFYYDPDYSFLDLGVLSAQFEIEWVKNHVTAPPANQNAFEYYYLGYYIHSCAKMRYKAQFRPSALLCSDTQQWVPLDQALPILDKTPVAQYRLADESASSVHVTDEQIEAAFDELMLQISAHVIFMEELRPDSQATVRPVLSEFIAHVGPDLASRFVCRLR